MLHCPHCGANDEQASSQKCFTVHTVMLTTKRLVEKERKKCFSAYHCPHCGANDEQTSSLKCFTVHTVVLTTKRLAETRNYFSACHCLHCDVKDEQDSRKEKKEEKNRFSASHCPRVNASCSSSAFFLSGEMFLSDLFSQQTTGI